MVTSNGNQILNNNLILKSLTFHFLSKNLKVLQDKDLFIIIYSSFHIYIYLYICMCNLVFLKNVNIYLEIVHFVVKSLVHSNGTKNGNCLLL